MRRDDFSGSTASMPEAARSDEAFAPTAAHPSTPMHAAQPARPPTIPPPIPARAAKPSSPCLQETQAMAFVAGQLADRTAVEEHIDDCPACRQLLAELFRRHQSGAHAVPRAANPSAPPPIAQAAQQQPQAMPRWTQQSTVGMQQPAPATPSIWKHRLRMFAAPTAASVLVGVLLGVAIGRCSKDGEVPPAAKADPLAQLVVTSVPVEANVVVDGRFVGVSPVERIDLDAGKHSIVIDAFGYQPYAGTVEMEASARASLKVVLAPIGGEGTTNGEFVGKGGKSANVKVPLSALTGTGMSRDAPAKDKPAGKPSRPRYTSTPSYTPPAPAYEPPPRPKRDCSGEKSRCRDSCFNANNSCRFNCPHCVTCTSSVGSEECKRQCESCRSGCEQNVKFCESSCDSNYDSCYASNSF